jgi:hypothetical protein
MRRTTFITLLLGLAAALAIALSGPGSAGALAPRTTTDGSATNANGTSGTPVNTVAPTLSRTGTVGVGTRLTCNAGEWANDPTAYRERWRRGTKLVHTGATYRTAKADRGFTLSCYVAASNEQGSAAAAFAGSVTVKR